MKTPKKINPVTQILFRLSVFFGSLLFVILGISFASRIAEGSPLLSIYLPLLVGGGGVMLFRRYRERITDIEEIEVLQKHARQLRLALFLIPAGACVSSLLFIAYTRSFAGFLASLLLIIAWRVADQEILLWSIYRRPPDSGGSPFLAARFHTLYLSFMGSTLLLPLLLLYLTLAYV